MSDKSDKNEEKGKSIWKEIDKSVLIPGGICLLLVVIAGAAFPTQFEGALGACVDWIMAHFKWLYIVCVCAITIVCFWLIFSKYGNIRLGGKRAKPSFSLFTWCTLSLTGTIAVGICFYGVSGPVNAFMNPPAFLNVAGGTAEAIIPSLKYCFLHYGIPPYFLMVFTWYAAFGGNAMLGILRGSDLFAQMQQFGDGIATFAFLDTLPLGAFMKWVFIIVAMMTFITFSDSVAYSFPMLLMKKTSTDISLTKVPKALNAAVAIFMGVLTMVLLFVGGYDALNQVIVALGFPAVIFTIIVLIAGVKFILYRDKYDMTYIEEMAEEKNKKDMEMDSIPKLTADH